MFVWYFNERIIIYYSSASRVFDAAAKLSVNDIDLGINRDSTVQLINMKTLNKCKYK